MRSNVSTENEEEASSREFRSVSLADEWTKLFERRRKPARFYQVQSANELSR